MSGRADELAALGDYEALASIAGATSPEMRTRVVPPGLATGFTTILDHPVRMVRAAAVCLQRGAPETQHPALRAALLADPVKSVFIAAARESLSLWIARMPDRATRDVNEAMRDWQGFLLAKACSSKRRIETAFMACEEAVTLDP